MNEAAGETVEIWNEADLWDDDALAAAHEGAAEDLLEYARSEAEQQARDEVATRALGIIVSASGGRFTDESRRLSLVSQLVASIGSLCDHNHLSKTLDEHFPGEARQAHTFDKPDDDEVDEDENKHRSVGQKKPWFGTASQGGRIVLKPLLWSFRKMIDRKQTKSV